MISKEAIREVRELREHDEAQRVYEEESQKMLVETYTGRVVAGEFNPKSGEYTMTLVFKYKLPEWLRTIGMRVVVGKLDITSEKE